MKLNLPYGLMAATLGLCLLTACGDEDNNATNNATNNTKDNTPLTSDQFFARSTETFINDQCKSIFQCPEKLGGSLFVYGRFKSEADCKTILAKNLDLGSFIKPSLASGRIIFNEDAAKKCIAEFEASFSTSSCTSDGGVNSQSPDCENIFQGVVAAEGKCLNSNECVTGFECNREGGECFGICKADPCAACTDAQYCERDAEGKHSCKTPLAIGADCTFSDICIQNASCLTDGGQTGQCIQDKSINEGDACQQHQQCKSGLCDAQICIAMPAPPILGKAGESCALFSSICLPSLTCQDVDEITQKGTCKAVAPLGADCDVSIQCEYGLFCQGATPGETKGKCADPLADGEACEDREQCQSDYCDGDTMKCASQMMCSI